MLKVIFNAKCTEKKSLSISEKIETFAIISLDPYILSFPVGKKITGCGRTLPYQLKKWNLPSKVRPSSSKKSQLVSICFVIMRKKKNYFVITLSLLSILVQELIVNKKFQRMKKAFSYSLNLEIFQCLFWRFII